LSIISRAPSTNHQATVSNTVLPKNTSRGNPGCAVGSQTPTVWTLRSYPSFFSLGEGLHLHSLSFMHCTVDSGSHTMPRTHVGATTTGELMSSHTLLVQCHPWDKQQTRSIHLAPVVWHSSMRSDKPLCHRSFALSVWRSMMGPSLPSSSYRSFTPPSLSSTITKKLCQTTSM
jgi:hypothetical protein